MGEKETSGPDLAKLYKSGATLTEIATEKGLGRFAVAYRLKKAGIERRNQGSPQKTAEEKAAFARQQLATTFGEDLPKVINDLTAGEVTARRLALEGGINYSTFRTWLERAGIEIPGEKRKYKRRITATDLPPAKTPTIIDLTDAGDPVGLEVLDKFNSRPDVPAHLAAGMTDRELMDTFKLTQEQIAYMREQLRKNGFSS